jgi:hypothetical protein
MTNNLTLEERFVWSLCPLDHSFEETKKRSCARCAQVTSMLEQLIKSILEKDKN